MPALNTALALTGLSKKLFRRPRRGRPPKNEFMFRPALFPGVPPVSTAQNFQEKFMEDLTHGTRNVDSGANADEVAQRLISSYPKQEPIIRRALRNRMTGASSGGLGSPAREPDTEIISRKSVARALRANRRA